LDPFGRRVSNEKYTSSFSRAEIETL